MILCIYRSRTRATVCSVTNSTTFTGKHRSTTHIWMTMLGFNSLWPKFLSSNRNILAERKCQNRTALKLKNANFKTGRWRKKTSWSAYITTRRRKKESMARNTMSSLVLRSVRADKTKYAKVKWHKAADKKLKVFLLFSLERPEAISL